WGSAFALAAPERGVYEMTNSVKSLVQALRKRCLEKTGVRRNDYDEEYVVLYGNLDGFARFILDETPPVLLLRCRDSVRRRLAKTSRGIRKSDRMYWKKEGWAWTDVGLD